MTLEKALEVKSRTGQAFLNTEPDEFEKADKLVVEAGERIVKGRAVFDRYYATLLPSETPE